MLGYVHPHGNKLINIFKASVVIESQGDFSKKRESKPAPFMFVGHRGQRTSLWTRKSVRHGKLPPIAPYHPLQTFPFEK